MVRQPEFSAHLWSCKIRLGIPTPSLLDRNSIFEGGIGPGVSFRSEKHYGSIDICRHSVYRYFRRLCFLTVRVLWARICVWRKLSVWTKDAYMRLSIFPNTYVEVILLRLCEININAFLSNGSKQMPIMPRYNSCLPVSRTVTPI